MLFKNVDAPRQIHRKYIVLLLEDSIRTYRACCAVIETSFTEFPILADDE